MRILLVEEWSEATRFFIEELHAGTGCRIEHAQSIDEGLSKIAQGHGSVDVALLTVGRTSADALQFPQRARTVTADTIIRCPQLVVLASPALPLPYAAKLTDQQVIYLLRDSQKQVVETVKVMLWKIRTSKSGPTIRIEFSGGHYRFFICGTTTSEEIRVSAQIGRLLLLLLRGLQPHTAEMLADELGISRQSVKKYMRELRVILEAAMRGIHLTEPVVDVAWMERTVGGTLCGLYANPVWG